MALLKFRFMMALVACLAVAVGGAGVDASPVPGTSCAVFPANNVWNTDISMLPVHPNSAAWLASANASTTTLHPDFGAAPYGLPFIVVDNTHPTVSPTFTYASESDSGPYPFDGNTPIEGGQNASGDRHALIINKDTCTLYELYAAYWNNGSPTAGSGAVFSFGSNALRPAGWTSADAAGLPIYAGLVRLDEVQAGAINHAIRFTVQHTDKSYIWPARHEAGSANDPNLPPMGARFRLKSSYDTSTYSSQTQVILRAMQHYGMFVADNGSNWFFQGTTDAWPDSLIAELKTVPAAQFEAVDESSLMVDPNSAAVAALGGPAASLSTTSLTFSGQLVGTTSGLQTVTLTNVGGANLAVLSLGIVGTGATDFATSADSCTGAVLTPNGTCTVGVAFTPSTSGTRSATLAFSDSAANSPQPVALNGTGVAPAPAANVSPISLSFGSVKIGTTSATQTVMVGNSGGANLLVSSVTLGGANPRQFRIAADTCSGATISPGGHCTLGIAFAPSKTGGKTATLTISDNAPGSPQRASLAGTGAH